LEEYWRWDKRGESEHHRLLDRAGKHIEHDRRRLECGGSYEGEVGGLSIGRN